MANKEELGRNAWQQIIRLFLSNEIHDRFHAATDAAGLPHPGSLKALLMVGDEAPPMRQLAEEMRCDASYVTGLVDTLEQADLAEREVSPTDRRVKLIRLTPLGLQARDRALAVLGMPPAGMQKLTVAETRSLAQLLGKMIND